MMSFEPYDPSFESPYPGAWSALSDVRFETDLFLARAREAIRDGGGREAEYIVAREYRLSCAIDGARRWTVAVPSGMLTDLASVPRLARPLVDRVGPHLEAAIVHDFLFVAWQDLPGAAPRPDDFRFANELMLVAMEAAGVSWMVRNAIYAAVASPFGWASFREPNPPPRYVRPAGATDPAIVEPAA